MVPAWTRRITHAKPEYCEDHAVIRIGFPMTVGLVALMACSASPTPAQAVPEPSPVPVSWELTLKHTQPARIQVDPGSGPKTYWYVLYTVTNNTGEDRDFHPEVERVSEIESELPAEQAVSMPSKAARVDKHAAIISLHPRIFEAISRRHAKTHPFLVEPVDAIGRLRQGKDYAISSVIVFPELDPRASSFTIYIGGLSGERIRKPNPAYNPRLKSSGAGPSVGKGANPRFYYLRKTLAIPYTLPGDVKTRRLATPALGRRTWVMR